MKIYYVSINYTDVVKANNQKEAVQELVKLIQKRGVKSYLTIIPVPKKKPK